MENFSRKGQTVASWFVLNCRYVNKFLRRRILVSSFLILLSGVPSIAQPELPFYDWGAGPCEYCLYGDWTAKKNTPIFRRMNPRKGVAFRVRANEKLTAVTGVVITTRAGVGKALADTFLQKYEKTTDNYSDVRINRNETFHILTNHGEGVYSVWFKGRVLEASMGPELITLRKPRFVWWIKIRNKAGQIGWTNMAQNFNGPRET